MYKTRKTISRNLKHEGTEEISSFESLLNNGALQGSRVYFF